MSGGVATQQSYPNSSGTQGQTRPDQLAGAEYVLGVRSEARGVAGDETFVGKKFFVPARAGAARVAGGVPTEACDHSVGMAGVGVDADPAAFAFDAPALHL